MDYSTPKRQLKSAIKKKSRYAKCDDLDEEDDESLQKTVNFEARVQTQKTTTNVSDDKENDGDDDDAWFSNAKDLVKRPPPTPSTPFHFANDFFDNVCERAICRKRKRCLRSAVGFVLIRMIMVTMMKIP